MDRIFGELSARFEGLVDRNGIKAYGVDEELRDDTSANNDDGIITRLFLGLFWAHLHVPEWLLC